MGSKTRSKMAWKEPTKPTILTSTSQLLLFGQHLRVGHVEKRSLSGGGSILFYRMCFAI